LSTAAGQAKLSRFCAFVPREINRDISFLPEIELNATINNVLTKSFLFKTVPDFRQCYRLTDGIKKLAAGTFAVIFPWAGSQGSLYYVKDLTLK